MTTAMLKIKTESKTHPMLLTLITSRTRKKILLKFFINSNVSGYLRMLESEFQESSNAIRIELNRFEEARLLKSNMEGNKKLYRANTGHPFYIDLHKFLVKIIGIENLNESVNQKISGLKSAWLTGRIARGLESGLFDLILVGEKLRKVEIMRLVEDFEKNQEQKIRFLILNNKEESKELLHDPLNFKIWEAS